MKRALLKTLVAAAAIAAFGLAQAQTRTIRFASQSADGQPVVLGMKKFAELVERDSGGRLKVNVVAGGALGSDQSNVSSVQGGTLEMAALNSGILASVASEFGIYDMPFLFADTREADAVLDGPFGQGLHRMLERKGIVGLGYYELGFRQFTNSKHPIAKVEDFAGLKLRVIPTPANVDWVRALGATPTPLPFPELYSALEQRTVDGQESPLQTIAGSKFHQVQKYLTLSNHQYNLQSILVSRKFWDTLPAADRKVVQDAARESIRYEREQSRAQQAASLDALKQAGMQVSELPPAEAAKLREQIKPVVARHVATVGSATYAAVMAELEKLRR